YNIVLALALRITGQAVLFYHHSSHYVLSDSSLMRAALAVAGRAPQIFCSPKMARLFCERYRPLGEILIINNSAWIAPVSAPARGDDDGHLRLGFLSVFSLEKGVGRAIATLRLLRQRG